MEALGDLAEEGAAGVGSDEELGNEQAGGGVERFGERKGVEIARVKRAAVGEAVVGGALFGDRHHRSGRFDDGETPLRKMRSEREQLLAGAGADGKKVSVGGQIGQNGAHLQEQRVAHRTDFGEAVVVTRCAFLVEAYWRVG